MKRMMKYLVFLGAMLMNPFFANAEPKPSDKTAYDFAFETLDGKPLPLSEYRGKVLLVVNTASKCGFTPQYKGLQSLYNQYKDQGLVIVGVPSNDFGEQEPGDSKQIKAFCELNYGVTFPITSKQAVTGDAAHPFFSWISGVLGMGSAPKWNFHKYLVDKQGNPVDFYLSTTAPDSDKITTEIERLIKEN